MSGGSRLCSLRSSSFVFLKHTYTHFFRNGFGSLRFSEEARQSSCAWGKQGCSFWLCSIPRGRIRVHSGRLFSHAASVYVSRAGTQRLDFWLFCIQLPLFLLCATYKPRALRHWWPRAQICLLCCARLYTIAYAVVNPFLWLVLCMGAGCMLVYGEPTSSMLLSSPANVLSA